MSEVSNDVLNRCRAMAKMNLKSAFELDTSFGVKISGAMIPHDGELARLIQGERHMAGLAILSLRDEL